MKKSDQKIPEAPKNLFSTYSLAKKFNVVHAKFTRKIKKHFEKIKQNGFIEKYVEKQRHGGWDIEYYFMDAPAMFFVTSLMGNTELILEFKKFATDEFKKHYNYPIDKEWNKIREDGKEDRRIETDVIKEFIEMARSQGSKHADMYYVLFTKMTYECLFIDLLKIECPNFRNIVNSFSLSQMQQADRIVARELLIGIAKHSYYKDVFKRTKEKVMSYASIVGKIPTEIATNKTLSNYEAQKKHALLSLT